MDKNITLIKNTIIVAIGQICTKFITFFLLPLYTATLSTSEYGIVDLLHTLVTLLLPLCFFQIDQALFRFLIDAREDDKKKKELISTSIVTIMIQIVVFIVFYLIVSLFIKNQFKYFLMINIIVAILSSTFLQISRGLGDNRTYSSASVITAFMTLLLNLVFLLYLKMGAYGFLLAIIGANITSCLYVIFKMHLKEYFSLSVCNKGLIKEIWNYSIPLIPNSLSWWVIGVSDRMIVSYAIGIAANGVYSVANKFSTISAALLSVFNLTWTESTSIHINDDDSAEYISGVINEVIKITTSLTFLIISVIPFMFRFFIIGEAYAPAYNQIIILMYASIFNIIVTIFGSIYIALKRSKDLAKNSVFVALFNISVNFLLIKKLGLYAASISTLLSYLILCIYRIIDVQKYIKIKLEKRTVVYSIIVGIILLCTYYCRLTYISLIGVCVALLYSFSFCKSSLIKILNYVFAKYKIKNKSYSHT